MGGKKKPKKLGSNLQIQWTQAVHHLIGRQTLFPFTYLLNPAFSVTNLSSCSTLERKDIPIVIQACLGWEYLILLRLRSPDPFQSRFHASRDQSPTAPPPSFCVPRSLSEYLLVISLEELQEAGLSASGAFHSSEAQVISDTLQILKIHAKILNPKTATFPNCGQLSRPEGNPKRTQGSSKPGTDFHNSFLASSSHHCYPWEELK